MNKQVFQLANFRPGTWRRSAALLGLAALWLGSSSGIGQEPSLSKYQLEAVFLFNFAKYVDWPATAFPNATAPITIGVMGADPFGENLQHMVEGKLINGRPFVIKHLASDSELSGCQILFISHSEAASTGGTLSKTSGLPILTVGEDPVFAQNGGIINFVLKNGNVRLQIDLSAARKAGLIISSRLLAVADVVKGKAS
jgi:hypothetical protein